MLKSFFLGILMVGSWCYAAYVFNGNSGPGAVETQPSAVLADNTGKNFIEALTVNYKDTNHKPDISLWNYPVFRFLLFANGS